MPLAFAAVFIMVNFRSTYHDHSQANDFWTFTIILYCIYYVVYDRRESVWILWLYSHSSIIIAYDRFFMHQSVDQPLN